MSLPIPTLGLHHVALRVRDLARAKAFYTEVFGFDIVWEPDAANAYLSSGSDNLALHEVPDPLPTGVGQPLDHLGLLVATPEMVDRAEVELRARALPIVHQPKTHRDGSRSLYCADPDGNVVQILYEPTISRRVRR
ncbi:MAG: VOC family protein [Deltaproteobacteria bacterium]|nr:VOC family protein [Deltaproteobacteria bacterium]MBI3387384.1 VOC family protein [Deltaproteobacteria bacterium]